MKRPWNAMTAKDVGLVREVVQEQNGIPSPILPCALTGPAFCF